MKIFWFKSIKAWNIFYKNILISKYFLPPGAWIVSHQRLSSRLTTVSQGWEIFCIKHILHLIKTICLRKLPSVFGLNIIEINWFPAKKWETDIGYLHLIDTRVVCDQTSSLLFQVRVWVSDPGDGAGDGREPRDRDEQQVQRAGQPGQGRRPARAGGRGLQLTLERSHIEIECFVNKCFGIIVKIHFLDIFSWHNSQARA